MIVPAGSSPSVTASVQVPTVSAASGDDADGLALVPGLITGSSPGGTLVQPASASSAATTTPTNLNRNLPPRPSSVATVRGRACALLLSR